MQNAAKVYIIVFIGGNMATIWDVAKLAGVSKSTVSRVINNGSTSPEAKKSVLDAIKKLNYQPSCFAQSIRTQKSMTIALMIPDSSNLFYTEIFKAVEEVAYSQRYMVTLCDTRNSPDVEIKYAHKLLARKIDGLIYATYKMDAKTQDHFVTLSETLPMVFIDYAYKNYENISMVAAEGYNSSREAVKFLYNKGKRKIAYVNFPRDVQVTYLRYEGYMKGLEDCGLAFSSDLVYFPSKKEETFGRELGFIAAKELLKKNSEIDAIMTAADPLAFGVMKYLKQAGINIPDDISIIGFDNNEICEVIEPMLTTIAQPIRNIGTISAKILLNKINGVPNEHERVFFSSELIERGSTPK